MMNAENFVLAAGCTSVRPRTGALCERLKRGDRRNAGELNGWRSGIRVALAFILPLAGTLPLVAQQRTTDHTILIRGRAQSFAPALAAIVAGNVPSGEALLLRDNVHQAGTLQGDIESARRLTHAALVLRKQLRTRESQLVAHRALAYLNEGRMLRSSAARASERAQIYELAGIIHERVLADAQSAKAAYDLAKAELPTSAAAQSGLARLQEAEDRIARNTGKRG